MRGKLVTTLEVALLTFIVFANVTLWAGLLVAVLIELIHRWWRR